MAHETALFWRRSVRDREGAGWALVHRLRKLIGTAQLESSLAELEASIATILAKEVQESPHALAVDLAAQTLIDNDASARERLAELEAALERVNFTEWVRSAPLVRQPLVSIVMATKGERPTSLSQALESIADQSYARVEVLIIAKVADARPETFRSDDRFQWIHAPDLGVGAARNLGLSQATGEYVTYADDDNTMGQDWIRAIVWAFTSDSEIDVVYGARLHQSSPGSMPEAFWWFERSWNPTILQSYNPIDTQALAHRAGLKEARWEEDLECNVDWELAIRLTAPGRVRPLPVRACTYTTTGVDRITDRTNTVEARIRMQARARTARRLRLMGIAQSFPRPSERGFESELHALRPRFDVSVASEVQSTGAATTAFPDLGRVSEAMGTRHHDLALCNSTEVAMRLRTLFEDHQIPFAVRVRSSGFELAKSDPFKNDGLFLGYWAYSHHASSIHGAMSLPPLIHDLDHRPPAPGQRSGLAFVSTCTPKWDWEGLINVLGALPGIERTVMLATCHEHEPLAETVADLLEQTDPRIVVRVDATFPQVMRSLSVASALFIARVADEVVGNPRSIIEAWVCGAIPIVPDTRELREFAGDHARYYTDPAQAIELVRALQGPREDLEKERLANADHAAKCFAAPSVGDAFCDELRSAFARWESNRAG